MLVKYTMDGLGALQMHHSSLQVTTPSARKLWIWCWIVSANWRTTAPETWAGRWVKRGCRNIFKCWNIGRKQLQHWVLGSVFSFSQTVLVRVLSSFLRRVRPCVAGGVRVCRESPHSWSFEDAICKLCSSWPCTHGATVSSNFYYIIPNWTVGVYTSLL